MTVQKVLLLPLLISFFLLAFSTQALGQIVNQLAYNVPIQDSNTQTGDIVSLKDGVYSLSTKEYDPGVYGVIDIDPQVSINKITEKSRPVVVNGQALVKVSKQNGDIKAGDLITTSKSKGIGQKATKSGHVLGKALEDLPSGSETATIPVLLNINYNQVSAQSESLTQAGIDQVASKVSSSIVSGNIPNLLKYVFALVLGSISFFIGLSHFVRSNKVAVEAIARNPMAKSDIQRQQLFGTLGILLICSLGLGISIWILLFL